MVVKVPKAAKALGRATNTDLTSELSPSLPSVICQTTTFTGEQRPETPTGSTTHK